ncbi:NB-ARC domain-containing protein [Anabaena cylindrica UHCC 0172]|uniref:WD40 domain-containing protein n=1 Tax=Anabaena cylindrica TaxID=1165 RepID=UPI002B1F8E8B|nr:NB-ARC domain-containing protein [Anabaena cylindrica]MEA5553645.1 NB-ARC domain-containing protein [Anabaena cylindrica UHCC 0172]
MARLSLGLGVQKWVGELFISIIKLVKGEIKEANNLNIESETSETGFILKTELRCLADLAKICNIKAGNNTFLSNDNIRDALKDLQEVLKVVKYECESPRPEAKLKLTFTLGKGWLDEDISESLKKFNKIWDQKRQEQKDLKKLQKLQNPQKLKCHYDWEEIPLYPNFFGRQTEIKDLTKFIIHDKYKLVGIIAVAGMGKTQLSIRFGKGGIGKTALAEKVAQNDEIQKDFDYIIGRRLNNAIPCEDLLEDIIKVLSDNKELDFKPNNFDTKLRRLLHYLKEYRCLIILDNFETLLNRNGDLITYRQGYEQYGQLLELIINFNSEHKSCLLFTSREKPPISSGYYIEQKESNIKLFKLEGLDLEPSKKIFKCIGHFEATEDDWKEIHNFYEGNPQVLELVADRIKNSYSSNISNFLKDGKKVFQKIEDLFDEQFNRISTAGKYLMYWLAINREPVSLETLENDLASPYYRESISDIVEQIEASFRLDKFHTIYGTKIGLSPLFTEYVNEKIISETLSAIIDQPTNLSECNKYVLIKPTSKDYIISEQKRLILKPIIEKLDFTFGNIKNLKCKLKKIIEIEQSNQTLPKGYAIGNILNLLVELDADLTGYDLSNLTIWQADLSKHPIRNVNFAESDLSKSVFREDFGPIRCVDFHPDGKLTAAGTTNGDVIIWDIEKEARFHTFVGHADWVWAVSFSPDGNILASAGGDRKVYLWNLETKEILHILSEHEGRIRTVVFNSNSSILASGSEDQKIILWNPESGLKIVTIDEHESWASTVAFSQNNKVLVSGSHNGDLIFWDISEVTNYRKIQQLKYPGSILSISFSPNNKEVAIAGDHDEIWIINIGTWNIFKINEYKGRTQTLSFNHDGQMLAYGGSDKFIRIYSTVENRIYKALKEHDGLIRGLTFSKHGDNLISGSEDQTIKIWSIETEKCIKTIRGYQNPIWSIAFSPNGSKIASGGEDCVFRIWNVIENNNKPIQELEKHKRLLRTITFSYDGSLVATGSYDGSVIIWDTNSWEVKNQLKEENEKNISYRVISTDFSRDNQKLAVSYYDENKVRVWDVNTWKLIHVISNFRERVRDVVFHPIRSNILLISGEDKNITVYDLENQDNNFLLEGHTEPVWSLSFSHDGKILASGSGDKTIRLWNLDNRNSIRLDGHTDRLRSVSFTTAGYNLVSGSDDQTVKVWNINVSDNSSISANCIGTFKGHQSWIWNVSFCSDSDTVASCSDDGTIKIWSIKENKCVRTLRPDRFYEGINIQNSVGLTDAQRMMLIKMGAIEE